MTYDNLNAIAQTDKLDAARQRLINIGRVVKVMCVAARAVILLLIALHVIGILGIRFSESFFRLFGSMYDQNMLFMRLLARADVVDRWVMPTIAWIMTIVMLVVFYYYIHVFSRMLDYITTSGTPFTQQSTRTLRKLSFLMLILLLYSVPLGIVTFVVTLLFSFVLEYGTYLQEKAGETNRIQGEMIVSFAEITENKSGQTGQHIKRVAEYTRILARALGIDQPRADEIALASTMHDIGKLLIPSEILEKPGRLTPEEYDVIKQHTLYGGQLLDHVEGDEMALARTIALEHHERPDGKGYPHGLKGGEIDLEGRIVAVADVYDALTSRRSYKEAWEEDRAYSEIVNGSGTQFDAQVVDAFKQSYPEIQKVRAQYAD